MKTKKLSLNKQTIASLNDEAMHSVKGGVVWTGCDSACTECTNQSNWDCERDKLLVTIINQQKIEY